MQSSRLAQWNFAAVPAPVNGSCSTADDQCRSPRKHYRASSAIADCALACGSKENRQIFLILVPTVDTLANVVTRLRRSFEESGSVYWSAVNRT